MARNIVKLAAIAAYAIVTSGAQAIAADADFSLMTSKQISEFIISAASTIEGNKSEIISSIDGRLLAGNQFERQRQYDSLVAKINNPEVPVPIGSNVKVLIKATLVDYDFKTKFYRICLPTQFYASGFRGGLLDNAPNLMIVYSPENAPPEDGGPRNICSAKGFEALTADRHETFPLPNAPEIEAVHMFARVRMDADTAERLLKSAVGGKVNVELACNLKEGAWGEAYTGIKRKSGVDCWIEGGRLWAGALEFRLAPFTRRQIVRPINGEYPLGGGGWVFFVLERGQCFFRETVEPLDAYETENGAWWHASLRHPDSNRWIAAFSPKSQQKTLRMTFLDKGQTYRDFTCR